VARLRLAALATEAGVNLLDAAPLLVAVTASLDQSRVDIDQVAH
jgi:hypothetical protein